MEGGGKENEGLDGGNVALIALDPGDLIICSPPASLLQPHTLLNNRVSIA